MLIHRDHMGHASVAVTEAYLRPVELGSKKVARAVACLYGEVVGDEGLMMGHERWMRVLPERQPDVRTDRTCSPSTELGHNHESDNDADETRGQELQALR